jgi:hypothetical protein
MSPLDAAIAESCPAWCTRSRHPRWPGEFTEAGAVVSVAHVAVLYRHGEACVDVHRWVEFAGDGTVVATNSTLSVYGFDHAIVGGDEVAELATALATAAGIVAGVAA